MSWCLDLVLERLSPSRLQYFTSHTDCVRKSDTVFGTPAYHNGKMCTAHWIHLPRTLHRALQYTYSLILFETPALKVWAHSTLKLYSIFAWSRYSSVHRTPSTLKLGILIAYYFRPSIHKYISTFSVLPHHLYAMPISEFLSAAQLLRFQFWIWTAHKFQFGLTPTHSIALLFGF